MSSETAVNGQHVVSIATKADEDDSATTTSIATTKHDQASALIQLNVSILNTDTGGDAVNFDTMATATTTDIDTNVNPKTGVVSRKRSLRHNADTTKRRNSKNRDACEQTRRVVDDFDSLFDEIRSDDDGSGDAYSDRDTSETLSNTTAPASPPPPSSSSTRRIPEHNRDVVDCIRVTNGNTSSVLAHSFPRDILTVESDANFTKNLANEVPAPLVVANTDTDANTNAKSSAYDVTTNAFADQAPSRDDDSPTRVFNMRNTNTNSDSDSHAITVDYQLHTLSTAAAQNADDQHVPYYASNTTSIPNIIRSSETISVEKSSSFTRQQCSLIEECRYNIPENVIKDVVRQSKHTTTTTTAEKKTTRKKKTTAASINGDASNSNTTSVSATSATSTTITSTNSTNSAAANNGVNVAPKIKKSKKGKKYGDEKENISVTKPSSSSPLTNHCDDDLNFHQILDDGDEFSNVCVRELRSGFGKFDQLTKKTLLHVRSQDSSRAQQHFSQGDNGTAENTGSLCKACGKNVFAMESIKAERAVWHRNCFRCTTCNKQLTVDIYSSHEGKLYCKPHFKDLFKPKVVVEDEAPAVKLKKPELIIRENQPLELPPDVVRASDKPDLGLDELSSLNVKSRFQVFEKPANTEEDESVVDRSAVCVKRSPSILSKLAKFQAKGMDVGVSSDIFNGIDYEESDSSQDEPDEANTNENNGITKSVVSREKPIAFNKMNDVKKNWENGHTAWKEERREERREELQRIRSRLFMGKQNKMREAYENAVAESEKGGCVKRDVEIKADKARLIKEKFEKGEAIHYEDSDEEAPARKSSVKDEDMDVFEAGISKKSRSLFQQMDAAAVKTHQAKNTNMSLPTSTSTLTTASNSCQSLPSSSPSSTTLSNGQSQKMVMDRQLSSENVVRSSDPIDEVVVKTADVSSKFKFFETYKPPEVKRKAFRITPPREGQLLQSDLQEKDAPVDCGPVAARCEDNIEDESQLLKKSNTTAKMLSLFRQLEEAQQVLPEGPKPMKKFTPPPVSSECSSENDDDDDDDGESTDQQDSEDDHIIRARDKTEDEYLKLAQAAAKAKSLKEKFEKWQPEKQSNNNAVNLLDSEQASLDTTKSLAARFESFRHERQPPDKPRPKVNRFVDKSLKSSSASGCCDTCLKTVYQLEKVEAGDKVFHRSCFRCSRCNGVLRMETFTMNNGQLYCVPHFKQLFIAKGNYDEGFGNDQHKSKWSATARPDVVPTSISNSVISNAR